jgi:hypothetical protein
MIWATQKTIHPTILLYLGIFIAMGTCLLNCCLAMIEEGYTYGHTDSWEGFMKYAIEMGSGAMTCISNFINIG